MEPLNLKILIKLKKLTSIILILFLSLLSSSSWSESFDDLVQRDGLYYKKSSDVPFTGEITGQGKIFTKDGSFKDGKKEGVWISYYYNSGRIYSKGKYKDGKREGEWVFYWDNGQLREKGEYKDSKQVGEWVYYNSDGTLKTKLTY